MSKATQKHAILYIFKTGLIHCQEWSAILHKTQNGAEANLVSDFQWEIVIHMTQ